MIEKKSLLVEKTLLVGLITPKQSDIISNDYLNELDIYL